MRCNIAMALVATALLGGCGGNTGYSTRPPAPCPRISILADGADLTRYRQGAVPDLGSMTFDARLIGFQARCDYNRARTAVVVSVAGIFDVERGPAGSGQRTTNVPWFIIVTDAGDGQVIERQDFVTPVNFDGNASNVRVQSRPVALNFPAEERLVENHNVRLSFQVTREQLEANRRRGAR